MVQIQLNLSEDEDRKLSILNAQWGLKDKRKALKKMIQEFPPQTPVGLTE